MVCRHELLGTPDVKAPTLVRRFVIDYAFASHIGTRESATLPKAKVSSSVGKIDNVVTYANPLTGGIRLSFTFDPKNNRAAELRAELSFADRRTAETWLYRWTSP